MNGILVQSSLVIKIVEEKQINVVPSFIGASFGIPLTVKSMIVPIMKWFKKCSRKKQWHPKLKRKMSFLTWS